MKLYIVRHQESHGNINGIIQGTYYNTPLTNKGIQSAKDIAEKLQTEINGKHITRIVSSPLERAAQTSEIIAKQLKLPVIYDSSLIEMNPGVLAGPKSNAKKNYPEYLDIWNNRGDLDGIPGAETGNELQARVIYFLEQYMKSDKDEVEINVSHAGFMRSMINTMNGISRTTNINVDYDNINFINDAWAHLNIKRLPLAKASNAYIIKTYDQNYVLKKILNASEISMNFQYQLSRYVAQKTELLSEVLFWGKKENDAVQILNYLEGNHIYGNLTNIQKNNLINGVHELTKILKNMPSDDLFKNNNLIRDKVQNCIQTLEESRIKRIGLKLLENPRYNYLVNETTQIPVHYDLHRSNILFRKDESIRFLDLGSIAYSPELFSPASLFMSSFMLNELNNFNLTTLVDEWSDKINKKDLALLMQARAFIGYAFFEQKLSLNEKTHDNINIYNKYLKSIELIEDIINNDSQSA